MAGLRIYNLRTQLYAVAFGTVGVTWHFVAYSIGTYEGKKVLRGKQCGSVSETGFFPCKFADMRFADWDHGADLRFAICDFQINHYNLRICVLHTGTHHKFAVMRLRNGPMNLRTNKKPRFLTPLVKRLAKSEDAKLGEYKVIECY